MVDHPVAKSSGKPAAAARFADKKRPEKAPAEASRPAKTAVKALSDKSPSAKVAAEVSKATPTKSVPRPTAASSARPQASASRGPGPASDGATPPAARPAAPKASAPKQAEPAPNGSAVPVADNGKPRKPNSGYSARDLEYFRDLLLSKRRELIGDMSSMEREALRAASSSNLSNLPIHMADMGTDNYEQEFTLGLVQKDRDLLREINVALAKMQNGTFGLCEGSGEPINKERLEYQPWARFSVEHQRKLERHGR
jgi:RNA polymerase-binding transcription factor DksA